MKTKKESNFEKSSAKDPFFLSTPRIIINGRQNIFIENHSGIAFYGENEIILNTNDFKLFLSGKNLNVYNASKSEIAVTGIFESISFGR